MCSLLAVAIGWPPHQKNKTLIEKIKRKAGEIVFFILFDVAVFRESFKKESLKAI